MSCMKSLSYNQRVAFFVSMQLFNSYSISFDNSLLNSFWAVPLIPYCSSFRRRIQWSTVSNAFLKSKNRTPLIRPLSIFSSHWLVQCNRAVSVE